MDISSMLEVQVNEVKEADSKENVTPKDLVPKAPKVSLPISQDESNFYKLMYGSDISAVRFRRLHCTACDTHIGSAPAECHNIFEHPVLRTLLCAKCRDFYGDGTFEQGDDATDMFCRWCANGGNLYCCSFCSNTFCYKCIKRNFGPLQRKRIEADEKWKCFVCDPSDLYTARATCWALLQHVQMTNRMLQHNCKLTQDEIDEKMNLDETQCCPRRRKRMRRRTGSNSEEEDETYVPKVVGPAVLSKRKKRGRGRPRLLNGSNASVSIRSNDGTSDDTSSSYIDHNEILPSLLSCEQTMVECENVTINMDGTIVSQRQAKTLPPTASSSLVQQPLYNTPVVSVVATSNLLQSPSPIAALRHMSSPMSHMTLYQALQCTSTPMVTIPNQNTNMFNRSQTPPSESQTETTTEISNVIEIESESEDIAVVGPSNTSRPFTNQIDSNKAVPVALVSSKSNYKNVKKQQISGRCNDKTLNQRLLPHGQEIDSILTNLKNNFQDSFKVSKREELKKHELSDARAMIRHLHREIRDTVSKLACINDRIIREFNRWKRSQLMAGTIQSELDSNNVCNKVRSEEIPLDMVCVNVSDSDSESCADSEYNVINSSEFVGTTNAVEGIPFFRKRIMVERAVGDASVSLIDKSVQVYDVALRDYDNCIDHSTLKAVAQSEKLKQALTSATRVKKPSENYENQFIHYLQRRTEAEDIQTDESNDLPDPNETSLKDLIEANSPFISEMLETMDKSMVSNNSNNSHTFNTGESNSKSSEHQETNSVTYTAVDDLVNMVNNITDDLDINKKVLGNSPAHVSKSHKQTKLQTGHVSGSDEICVVNILRNRIKESSRTNCSKVGSESSNEDDCTIIDD